MAKLALLTHSFVFALFVFCGKVFAQLPGLPLNRPLWDGADVLAGPGFLAGCDSEGNLTSLPQSAMDFYKEKFRAFIIEI